MVFTQDGKNLIRDFLAGSSPTAPTHIAFGGDDTAATETDTALIDEIVRIAIDTTSTSDKTVEFNATLSSVQSNGETFAELGLFNASSSGTMLQRTKFNNVDKTSTIELQAIITVRIK